MSSSTNQQYKPGALRPTPTTDQHYKGVILRPNQLASLTSYGAFVSSAVAPGGKYSQSDLQAAESLADLSVAQNPSLVNRDCNPSTCNTIARNPSEQTAIDNSPTTSDAEIHPSAGVSLNQVDSTIPSTTHHQTTTFSKLAKQQGIRDWNNSVFDDRWLLQPEEMWNLNPRSNSGVTVSPGRQSLNGNSFGGQHPATRITEASHPATVLKSQMERLIQEAGERKSEIRNRHGPTEPLNARWAGIHNPLAAYGQLVDTDEEHHGNR